MEKDFWISGFPDYEVGSAGRVRSYKSGAPILLKEGGLSEGYYSVTLYRGSREGKRFLVHRLVAEYFLNPPSLEIRQECLNTSKGVVFVNHKDGNRRNNNVDNLEWCTPSHNNQQTFEMGRVVLKGSKK